MADDGGSSGVLRDEYGILPPGDARQCMIALSSEERSKILRELFNFRFNEGEGHNLGNLIIGALVKIRGGTAEAIKEAGNILGIRGKVLPVTTDDVMLCAETEDGNFLNGQTNISYPGSNIKIKRIFYKPRAFAYSETIDAIKNADKIVICPGELYGSILPNMIVEGVAGALKESKAMKVYVCNLFTREGTQNFMASDFVKEIEGYAGIKIDRILINTGRPSEDVLAKYLSEKSNLVWDDLQNDARVIRGDYAAVYPSEKKTLLRHVPEKIARAIVAL
jgi:uncharacterized cofD-like protein